MCLQKKHILVFMPCDRKQTHWQKCFSKTFQNVFKNISKHFFFCVQFAVAICHIIRWFFIKSKPLMFYKPNLPSMLQMAILVHFYEKSPHDNYDKLVFASTYDIRDIHVLSNTMWTVSMFHQIPFAYISFPLSLELNIQNCHLKPQQYQESHYTPPVHRFQGQP